jgi:hypothetical protein
MIRTGVAIDDALRAIGKVTHVAIGVLMVWQKQERLEAPRAPRVQD